MGKLQTIGGALLLLGCYHVFMQQYVFTSSATTGVGQRRRGSEAASTPLPCKTSSAAVAPEVSLSVPGEWVPPAGSNLRANNAAAVLLATAEPRTTTIHFTFGSFSMMDFLHNWRHFILKAGLAPAVVGAADSQMFQACSREGIPALEIVAGLDVWTYTRSKNASTVVQEGKSSFKYYRHHKSSFLELGLVKVAFLWELVELGYDVLISDLDIVWLQVRHARSLGQCLRRHRACPATPPRHERLMNAIHNGKPLLTANFCGCHAAALGALDDLPWRGTRPAAAAGGVVAGDVGRARVDG